MKMLENKVDDLQSENIKLTSEMKLLRDEHTEVLHSMFTFEKKNQTLTAENNALKQMIGHQEPA